MAAVASHRRPPVPIEILHRSVRSPQQKERHRPHEGLGWFKKKIHGNLDLEGAKRHNHVANNLGVQGACTRLSVERLTRLK